MKFAWHDKIESLAGSNLKKVEEVEDDDHLNNLDEYQEMLEVDRSAADFNNIEDEFVVLDD